MATADHDGHVAQVLSDRLTCLGMEIREAYLELEQKLRALAPPAAAPPAIRGAGTTGTTSEETA